MRIWYPDGRYYTLGLDPYERWREDYKRLYKLAEANAPKCPERTRFEVWEGRIAVTATLVLWPWEIYLYFASHTGIFTAGWLNWVLAVPLSFAILAVWRILTRRWRSDKAFKEYKKYWDAFFAAQREQQGG